MKRQLSKGLAVVLTLLMLVSLFPVSVFAGTGEPTNPGISSDPTDYPVYPAEGSVQVMKDAGWRTDSVTGEENRYAQVTLDVQSVPKVIGTDTILVLDVSGSMAMTSGSIFGNLTSGSNSYSPDLNTAHANKQYTVTVPATYYRYSSNRWRETTSNLTLTVNVHGTHKAEGATDGYIYGIRVTGFESSSSGYRLTQDGTTFYTTSNNNYTTYALSSADLGAETRRTLTNNNDGAAARAFLASVFGNKVASAVGGTSFKLPTSAAAYGLNTVSFTRREHVKGHMGDPCLSRYDAMMDAAYSFVDAMAAKMEIERVGKEPLEVASNNRVSIVTFAGSSPAATAFFDLSTPEGIADAKAALDNAANPSGNTNYQAGMTSVTNAISGRSGTYNDAPASERACTVLFMSDGAPQSGGTTDANLISYRNNAVAAGGDAEINIHTVGMQLTDTAKNKIGLLATSDSNKHFVSSASELDDAFKLVAASARISATGAVIEDPMGAYFNLDLTRSFEVWRDGVPLSEADARAMIDMARTADDLLVLNAGTLSSNLKIVYWVELKSNEEIAADGLAPLESGKEYPTNAGATISYKNYREVECEKPFPDPQLPFPGGTIKYMYYLSDASGWPVSLDGNIVSNTVKGDTDNLYNLIHQNGYLLEAETLYKPAGSDNHILTVGQTYTISWDGTYLHDVSGKTLKREGALAYLRHVSNDGTTTYTPIDVNAKDITIANLGEQYTVMIGYYPEFEYTVEHDYDDVALDYAIGPDVTAVGTELAAAPDLTADGNAPAGKFELESAAYTVTYLDGSTATPDVFDADKALVAGTKMPFGDVAVDYSYLAQVADVTIEYYQGEVATANKLGEVVLEDVDLGTLYKDLTFVSNYSADFVTESGIDALDPENGYNHTGVVVGAETWNELGPKVVASGNVIQVFFPPVETSYTVWYYKDALPSGTPVETDANYLGKVTGGGNFGETIGVASTNKYVVNANLNAPTGYTKPGVVSGITTLGATAADNNVFVLFSDKISYTFKVKYYTDSVSDENYIENADVPGSASFGTSVETILAMHNNKLLSVGASYLPTGYVNPGELDVASSITSIGVSDNVINVVLSKMDDLQYTVKFYTGSSTSPTYLGADKDVTGSSATFDETIGVGSENDIDLTATIAANRPTGWQGGAIFDLSDSVKSITRIGASSETNIVYVLYGETMNVDVTINYYYGDAVDADKLVATGTQAAVEGTYFGNVPVELDYTALTADWKTAVALPVGYDTTGAKDDSSWTGTAPVVTIDANNVINVFFGLKTVTYEVQYYKDDATVAGNLVHSTGSQNTTYGNSFGLADTDVLVSLTVPSPGVHPMGYVEEGTVVDPADLPGTFTADHTIIKVQLSRAEVPYKVVYQLDDGTVLYETPEQTGLYGQTIGSASTNDIKVPLELPTESVNPVPESHAADSGSIKAGSTTELGLEDNVVIVQYPIKTFPVTVNYYRDAVAQDNLLGSADIDGYKWGLTYAEFETEAYDNDYHRYASIVNGTYAMLPLGYGEYGMLDEESSFTVLPDAVNGNVVNVILQPERMAKLVFLPGAAGENAQNMPVYPDGQDYFLVPVGTSVSLPGYYTKDENNNALTPSWTDNILTGWASDQVEVKNNGFRMPDAPAGVDDWIVYVEAQWSASWTTGTVNHYYSDNGTQYSASQLDYLFTTEKPILLGDLAITQPGKDSRSEFAGIADRLYSVTYITLEYEGQTKTFVPATLEFKFMPKTWADDTKVPVLDEPLVATMEVMVLVENGEAWLTAAAVRTAYDEAKWTIGEQLDALGIPVEDFEASAVAVVDGYAGEDLGNDVTDPKTVTFELEAMLGSHCDDVHCETCGDGLCDDPHCTVCDNGLVCDDPHCTVDGCENGLLCDDTHCEECYPDTFNNASNPCDDEHCAICVGGICADEHCLTCKPEHDVLHCDTCEGACEDPHCTMDGCDNGLVCEDVHCIICGDGTCDDPTCETCAVTVDGFSSEVVEKDPVLSVRTVVLGDWTTDEYDGEHLGETDTFKFEEGIEYTVNIHYTYTSPPPPVPTTWSYTINYYVGAVAGAPIGSSTRTIAEGGGGITLSADDLNAYRPGVATHTAGAIVSGNAANLAASSFTVTGNGQHVNVLYTAIVVPPGTWTYTVQYWQDAVGGEGVLLAEFTGEVPEGGGPAVVDILGNHPGGDYLPGSMVAGDSTTVVRNGQLIRVLYTVGEEVVPPIDPPITPPDEPVPPEPNPIVVPEVAWALLNLMIAVLTLVFGVMLIFGLFMRNKKKEEQSEEAQEAEETERNPKSGLGWRILAILAGIAAPIVFFITENMRNPMIFVDKWTPLMVIILVVQVIGMLLLRRARNQEDENDEAESEA